MMGSIAKVAGQGMNYNLSVVAEKTHEISKYNTGLEKESSLVSDITEITVAQNNFEANAKMIETSDDMLDTILSMV